MDGSVRTEQALQEEVRILRARIATLEETERRHQHLSQQYQAQQSALEEAQLQQQELLHKLAAATEFTEQSHPFDIVFETITTGLALYDINGNILRMNTVYRQMMGIDRHPTYLANNLEERGHALLIHNGKGQALPPEQWPINRILRGEVLGSQQEVDVGITTLDGRELLVTVSGAPMYDAQGKVSHAVVIYQDTTERSQLNQRTHDVLRALLAMAEILVQGTDLADSGETPIKSTVKSSIHRVLQRLMKLARRVLGCQRISITLIEAGSEQLQPVAIVGVDREEILQWQAAFEGMPFSSYISDHQQQMALHAGGPVTIYQPTSFDPTHRHYAVLMPMHTGTRLIGFITIDYGDDVHTWTREEVALAEAVSRLTVLVQERERLLLEQAEAHAKELALLEANQRMDEFLSIASHELRTPLTTINGNIQLAKRRAQTLTFPPETPQDFTNKIELIQELLSRAERQVRIQNRLVGDLLDVSRIQADRLELHMKPCNLLDIVNETIEDQRSANTERTIVMQRPEYAAEFPILADADRVSQVISNYLSNALKYSASDHAIRVYLDRDGPAIRLSVRDAGPGIPLATQDHLWERFYRVPGINVLSGSGVGLGLGLHICRTIIERHQGEVGVISAPDQGSTFWFTLPYHQQSESLS